MLDLAFSEDLRASFIPLDFGGGTGAASYGPMSAR